MGGATGLLTGTFDPVHLGHVALAEAAQRVLGLERVWFVVNPDPEHKLGVTAFHHRLAMVRLAVAGHPALRLYEGPLRDQPHNLSTFQVLMQELAAPAYVFVLGQDTLARLDTWNDPQSVVDLAPYAVASRHGASHEVEERLRRRLGPVGRGLRVSWFDLESDQTAASRTIRDQLGAGQAVSGLDPQVAGYIRDHNLYR